MPDSTWTVNGLNIFNANSGNVGIGTTTPGTKLDVNGTARFGLTSGGGNFQFQQNTFGHYYASDSNPRMIYGRDIVPSGGTSGSIIFNQQGQNFLLNGAGIGQPAVQSLAFFIGNGTSLVERIRINSSGNVGIGTTTVPEKLTINDGGLSLRTTGLTTKYILDTSWNASAGDFFSIKNSGAANPQFLLASSGNVGIGTTSPAVKLDFATSTGDVINVRGGHIRGLNSVPLDRDYAVPLGYIQDNYNASSTNFWGGSLSGNIWSNNSSNVGIGTSSPNHKLTIAGGNIKIGSHASIGNAILAPYPLGGLIVKPEFNINDSSSAVLDIQSNTGASLVTFKEDGKVGIGDSNPGVRFVNSGAFNVNVPTLGSASVGANAILSQNGLYGLYTGVSSNGDVWQQVQRNDASTTTYRLLLNPLGGNVGIGTTTPLAKLDVFGNIKISSGGYIYGTVSNSPYIRLDGALYSELGYGSTSAIRADGSSVTIRGTAGAERLRVDASGNFNLNSGQLYVQQSNGSVGIGTTAQEGKLSIRQAMSDYANSFSFPHLKLQASGVTDNTGFVGITYAGSSAEAYGWSVGALRSTNGLSSFTFKHHNGSNSGNERMRITNDGLVGIGTTSPASTLAISGGTGTVLNVHGGHIRGLNSVPLDRDYAVPLGYIQDNYNASSTNFWGGSLSGNIWSNNSSNVGIGTTNPGGALHVSSPNFPVAVIERTTAAQSGIYASDRAVRQHASGLQNGAGISRYFALSDSAGTLRHAGSFGVRWIDSTARTMLMSFNVADNGVDPTSGTEKMVITGVGNVGIGTSTPGVILDVNGGQYSSIIRLNNTHTDGGANAFLISTAGGWGAGLNKFGIGFGSATSNNIKMVVDGNTGNVGIGTTTPTSTLHVAGNILTTGLAFSSSPTDVKISWADIVSAGGGDQWVSNGLDIYNKNYASGKVGIGVTNPDERVHIYGTSLTRLHIQTTSGASALKQTSPQGSYGWYTSGTSNLFGLQDYTAGTARMVVDGTGNVGINDTNPADKLTVAGGNIAGSGALKIASSTATSWIQATTTTIGLSSAAASRLGVWGNQSIGTGYLSYPAPANGLIVEGSVGIGTTNPGDKLEVNGDIGITNSNKLNFGSQLQNPPYIKAVWNDNNNTGLEFHTFFSAADVPALTLSKTGGNVGIGIVDPRTRVDIVGASPKLRLANNVNNAGEVGVEFSHSTYTGLSEVKSAIVTKPTLGYGRADMYFILDSAADSAGYVSDNVDTKMIIRNNGFVGIGTTNPGGTFHVSNASSSNALIIESSGKTGFGMLPNVNFQTSFNGGFWAAGESKAISVSASYGPAGYSLARLGYTGSSPYYGNLKLMENGTSKVYFDANSNMDSYISAGRVGIGTTTPTSTLHVAGNILTTGLAFSSSPTDVKISWADIVSAGGGDQWVSNGLDIYNKNYANGKVGVGTTAPGSGNIVNVKGLTPTVATGYGNATGNMGQLVLESSDSYTTQKGGRIAFSGNAGANGGAFAGHTRQDSVFGIIEGFKSNNIANNAGGGLIFKTNYNPDGQIYERMRITDIGNVGIGLTNPSDKLSVIGSISGAGALKISSSTATSWIQATTTTIGLNSAAASRLGVWGNQSIGTGYLSYPAPVNGLIVEGNVGIGTTNPTSLIHVSNAYNTTTNYIAQFDNTYIGSGAPIAMRVKQRTQNSSAGASIGFAMQSELFATTQNSSATSIIGGDYINLFYPSGYTVSTPDSIGLRVRTPSLSGTGASNISITSSRGILIQNQGGASMTNSYGLYIDSQSGSSNSNYSIYSAGGLNYFSGNVGIGTVSPGAKLDSLSLTEQLRLSNTASHYVPFVVNSGGALVIGTTSIPTSNNVLFSSRIHDTRGIQSGVEVSPRIVTSVTIPSAYGLRISPTIVDNAAGNEVTNWYGLHIAKPSGSGEIENVYGAYIDGNVGIGTTAPTSTLHVAGNILTTGLSFSASSTDIKTSWADIVSAGGGDQWLSNGLDIYNKNYTNGKVGIGTSNPGAKLTLRNASGVLSRYEITNANANQVQGTWDFYTNTAATPDFFGKMGFKFEGGIADANKQFQISVADLSTPKMVVTGGGNVGIGLTNPSDKLSVIGSISGTGSLQISSSTATSWIQATTTTIGLNSAAASRLGVWGNQSIGTGYLSYPAPANGLIVEGSVGIGTTNPTSILELKHPTIPILTLSSGSGTILAGNVVSSINTYAPDEYSGIVNRVVSSIQSIADINYEGSQAPTALAFLTQSNGGVPVSEKMRITSSGNVGVGTTNPAGRLNVARAAGDNLVYADVYSTTGGHSNYWFSRRSRNNSLGALTTTLSGDYQGVFYFQGVNTSNAFAYGAEIVAQQNGAAGIYIPTDLRFSTYSSTDRNSNQLVLSTNNNVGIGHANPLSRLVVKGSGTASTTSAVNVTNSADTSLLFIRNDGTIGIGTTTPASTLHVAGNILTTGLAFSASSTDIKFSWADIVSAGGGDQWLSNGSDIYNKNYASGGKVGIGVTNPEDLLNVKGDNSNIRISSATLNTGTLGLLFDFYPASNSQVKTGIFTSSIGSWGRGNMYFSLNNAPDSSNVSPVSDAKLTILNSGNVGINDTNPADKLTVVGSVYATDGLKVGSSTAANWIYGRLGVGHGSAGTSKLAVNGNQSIGSGYYSNQAPTNGLIVEGSVGIGTTNPLNKLDIVAGSSDGSSSLNGVRVQTGTGANPQSIQLGANDSGTYSWIQSRQYGISANNLSLNPHGGNVGIGTTDPQGKLQVGSNSTSGAGTMSGVARIFGSMALNSVGTEEILNLVRPFNSGVSFGRFAALKLGGYSGGSTRKARLDIALSENNDIADVTVMTLQGNGNVGVGSTNPLTKLHIENQATFNTVTPGPSAYYGLHFGGQTTADNAAGITWNGGTTGTQAGLYVQGSGAYGTKMYFATTNSYATGAQTRMTIDHSGNVGIGTTSPITKLHVNGTITAAGLCFGSDCKASWDAVGSFWSGSLTGNISNSNSGNVGIGTTSPRTKLHINAGTDRNSLIGPALTLADGIRIESVNDANTANKGLEFRGSDFTWTNTGSEKMRLTAAGSVGINDTNPSDKLTVVGGVYATDGLKVGSSTAANWIYGRLGVGHGSAGTSKLAVNGNQSIGSGYYSNQAPTNGLIVEGNVGVGTTAPSQKMHVVGTLRIQSADYNGMMLLGADSGTTTVTNNANKQARIAAVTYPNTYNMAVFATESTVNNDEIIIGSKNGNAAVAPTLISFHTTPTKGDSLSTGERMRITSAGNVGIGTTSPASTRKLSVVGNTYLNGTLDVTGISTFTASASFNGGASVNGNLTMTGTGNILGVNKISAAVIDPLYNIKGINYSTYAPAIVGGLKEEYVSRINAASFIKKADYYETVIDLTKETIGSDLWVWRQVVEFNDHNVEVFLTPRNSFAQVYSLISEEKIIVRSDRPADLSLRLVGNRFDWRDWPTKPLDQSEKALLIIK